MAFEKSQSSSKVIAAPRPPSVHAAADVGAVWNRSLTQWRPARQIKLVAVGERSALLLGAAQLQYPCELLLLLGLIEFSRRDAPELQIYHILKLEEKRSVKCVEHLIHTKPGARAGLIPP